MKNFSDTDISKASMHASSYQEFKDNLRGLGNDVPKDVGKFPMSMKGFKRKLRYEISNDPKFGTPTTAHDIRQARYYERLERLGYPNPLMLMRN